MSKTVAAGITRVGHLVGPDAYSDEVASVTFDAAGATVVWPRRLSFVEAMTNQDRADAPAVLYFRDAQGHLLLREGRMAGSSSSSTGTSEDRLRYSCVVESASHLDYGEVNGMCTEIEGLAKWAGVAAVRQEIEFTDNGFHAVTLRGENQPSVNIGGDLNLTLETAVGIRQRASGTHTLVDHLRVRTTSASLKPWVSHAASHRMIQDLMCTAYGRVCAMRIVSVMRDDDQPVKPTDARRYWSDVYQPDFGRPIADDSPLPEDAEPLFSFADTDRRAVAKWIDDFGLWSRPTWIAVTTLFQRGSTVEAQLLQIGVALESLGFAIWKRSGGAGVTPNYPELLKFVTDAVGIEHVRLFGGKDAATWRREFNRTFKGTKHADNPLPDPTEAWHRSVQGFTLLRCWLAAELGVDGQRLLDGLSRQQ